MANKIYSSRRLRIRRNKNVKITHEFNTHTKKCQRKKNYWYGDDEHSYTIMSLKNVCLSVVYSRVSHKNLEYGCCLHVCCEKRCVSMCYALTGTPPTANICIHITQRCQRHLQNFVNFSNKKTQNQLKICRFFIKIIIFPFKLIKKLIFKTFSILFHLISLKLLKIYALPLKVLTR